MASTQKHKAETVQQSSQRSKNQADNQTTCSTKPHAQEIRQRENAMRKHKLRKHEKGKTQGQCNSIRARQHCIKQPVSAPHLATTNTHRPPPSPARSNAHRCHLSKPNSPPHSGSPRRLRAQQTILPPPKPPAQTRFQSQADTPAACTPSFTVRFIPLSSNNQRANSRTKRRPPPGSFLVKKPANHSCPRPLANVDSSHQGRQLPFPN
jgi:hypothetical protein